MNLMLPLGVWGAVFASWFVVVLLRWSAGKAEDDHIHIMDGDQVIAHQSETAHRLDVLDRWKTILFAVVLIYGLVLAGFHLYNVWLQGNASHVG